MTERKIRQFSFLNGKSAFIGWLLFVVISVPVSGQRQPNIIFIIADDISWEDIGANGNRRIKTPNLDKLASDGIRFTNVFLTASSCSPSRTSILTGRYPHNTGAAELHTPLPASQVFFPELLKSRGYFTALAGKWHEGAATKRAYDTLLVDRGANGEGGEGQWINLLRARPGNKPFFFWLSPFDAHRPWSKETAGHRHNPDTDVEVPAVLLDTPETREDLASYYNEIANLDYHVGLLVDELERAGIADNTLLIFTADNGRAFPGSKTRVNDAGLRTPFFLKWPGKVKTGQVCESLISSIDIAPTLLEAGGTDIPATFQGKSFFALLTQPTQPFRKYVFGEHNWHDYAAYERSVRTKEFLYIVNRRPQYANSGPIDANQSPSAMALLKADRDQLNELQRDVYLVPRPTEEFYDNLKDPSQTKNLVTDPTYATALEEHRRVLQLWQKETGDTEPQTITPDWYHRDTGEPLPLKGERGEMPGRVRKAETVHTKGPF